MYYTIYKITNKINQKYYIGYHQTKNLDDTYMGSGIAIKRAIKKYGLENFEKEILFIFDNSEEMINKEKDLVDENLVLDPMSYNMNIGGYGGSLKGRKLSEEAKSNISKATSGKNNPMYGKLGKDNPNFGRKNTEETKEKIRKSLTGENNSWYGKKHTEETKRKMSENRKGEKNSMFGVSRFGSENPRAKKVIYKDMIFNTCKELAEYLGVSKSTITNRLRKDNDYKIIDGVM